MRTFIRCLTLLSVVALTACAGGGAAPSASYVPGHGIDCVPFARALTGVHLSGDAPDWWEEAASRYERSQSPLTGSILAFRATSRLPHGHVSVVSKVISDRKILVTQANWVHGRITQDEPVLDVSPDNDWTRVRVWWQPSHTIGNTIYPTYGFIVPARRLDHEEIAERAPHAAVVAVAYRSRD